MCVGKNLRSAPGLPAAPTCEITSAAPPGPIAFTEVLEHSTYVPENLKLTKLARDLPAEHDPVAAVRAAGGFVHSEMSSIPGTTGVHSSAIDAWQARPGVCQDYAHLTLLLLRGIGMGRDYGDVPPLKGIYSGGGSTALDVVVEITRLAGAGVLAPAVLGAQPGGHGVEACPSQHRTLPSDAVLGHVQHPVQAHPARSPLGVPAAGA